jgi:uncharacterized protein (TIGR02099 family)
MTRLLAFSLIFLRGSLWLGAIVLMLMALYVSLGRQLVPLVAEYRLEAQDKAGELLQMPVSVGRLEGRWEGFSPRLLAFDVLLGEGDAAMRLDRLAVVPDLVASLWHRTPQLKTLEFAGVHLDVVQGAEGNWRVEGLPQREEQPPPDLQKIMSELQRIAQLRVVDSQITLEPFGEAPRTLTYANVELRTSGERLRLDGRLLLPDGQPLSVSGQADVQPRDWKASKAQLYVSLPQSDWGTWVPASLTGDWSHGALRVGGEFWFDWLDRGLARAVARLNAPDLQVGHAQRDPVQIQDLSLNVYLDRDTEGYRVQLDGLAFNFADHRWQDSTLVARQQGDADSWRFQADRIALAPLAALVEALAPLPEVAANYLTGLAPSGTLRNVEADYRPSAELPERLTFSANLDGVSIAAYHWIPAARNVSGEVKGNLGGGELRFDSQDFSLHLAELFPAPWDYRRSRGRLVWTLNDEAFTLAAPYLRVEGEEGLIAGDFLIRLMRDPAAEDYMDLRVGISDADARFTGKYLPTRSPALSPALSEWLSTAIQGGTVEQGYFQYQGSLSKSAADSARSISLYFKVKDAELAFQSGWPVLRDGRGEVLIENSGVRVRVPEARMLDSRVHEVTADIPRSQTGQPPRLSIRGKVDGSVNDVLTLVQTAPIGTEELFAGWRGEGPLNGQLHLDIPLVEGERPKATVDFVSSKTSLYIAQVDLGFQGVEGAFRYDTESGLSADSISAQVLGTSVHGRASATGSPGKPTTRIEANGTVDVEQLKRWQKIERALPVSGQLPAQLSLTLGTDDTRLQVDSSLQGVEIDMPAPYGKPAAERRDTTFRMTLNGDQQRYTVRHAGLAALTFSGPPGDLANAGGELVLGGGAANLRTGPGLDVRGSVSRVDIREWQAWLEKYRQPSEDQATASLVQRVRMDVGTLEAFDTSVENLSIDLQRLPAAWQLGLDSQTVAGTVRLPDAQGQPVDVDLAHLRLPAANPEVIPKTPSDPLADVDPGQLPSVDVRVAQLMRGEELLGAGALKMRPFSGGVDFSDLSVELKGLNIGGAGGWSGSQSWFKGRLEGGNIEDVLLAWGLAPSTTSEDFRLDADVRWPGSPAYFGLSRLSGQLDARLRKGQLREIDGGAQALRVFGLLNLESIGRRLRLDFSDLFSKGLSYDRIAGQLTANDGVYLTSKPLAVTGPSSDLELDGRLDMVADQIDAKVLVTLPVSNNLPLAALIVGAPAIGGALFVADKLLGDRVARFATVQYKVEGSLLAPKVTFDKPFERPN